MLPETWTTGNWVCFIPIIFFHHLFTNFGPGAGDFRGKQFFWPIRKQVKMYFQARHKFWSSLNMNICYVWASECACVTTHQFASFLSNTLQTRVIHYKTRAWHQTACVIRSWLVVNKLSDNSVSCACEEITLTDYLNLVDANTLKMYLHRKSISVISE